MKTRTFGSMPIFSLIFALATVGAHAATITVGSSGVDELTTNGTCSLREAVYNANTNSATYVDCAAGTGDDTLELQDGTTYTLSKIGSGELGTLVGDLNLNDRDHTTTLRAASHATIDAVSLANGGDPDRILYINTDASVTLENLTLFNGALTDDTASVSQGYKGGCVFNAGTLTMNNIILDSCRLETASTQNVAGAAIYSQGTLSLNDSTIRYASASLYDDGHEYELTGSTVAAELDGTDALTMARTVIQSNTGFSTSGDILGTVYVAGTGFQSVVFDSVYLETNTLTASQSGAAANGGGLYLSNLDDVAVVQSTIANSFANSMGATSGTSQGGGIFVDEIKSQMAITNSTISGNQASAYQSLGGGLSLSNSASAAGVYKLSFVTVANNVAGRDDAGIVVAGGVYHTTANLLRLQMINSIIADNTLSHQASAVELAPDCYFNDTLESLGYNVIENSDRCGTVSSFDITGQDPELQALNEDGGFAPTHALPESSVAIQMASASCADVGGAVVATDQRGVTRTAGTCEPGAYEYETVVPPDSTPDTTGNTVSSSDSTSSPSTDGVSSSTSTDDTLSNESSGTGGGGGCQFAPHTGHTSFVNLIMAFMVIAGVRLFKPQTKSSRDSQFYL